MVEIAPVDAQTAGARQAMAAYFAELADRFPGGFDPGETDPATYSPPYGLFLTASRGSEVVACGAVQYLDDDVAEIKRMWVRPDVRGLGIGKKLLARLEEAALDAGRRRVVLDTNGVLTEAIAMYRAAGYVEIERYNDNPYAERWFEKRLS